MKPADGRFGSGPSRVRPEQLEHLAGTGRDADGHLAPPEAGQGSSSGGSARGSRELFALPDGYEVVLGNGGTTAFWDAAACCLVRERAAAPDLRRVLLEVRRLHPERAVPGRPDRRRRRARRRARAGRRRPRRRDRVGAERDVDRRDGPGRAAGGRRRRARADRRAPPRPAACRSTSARPTSTTSPPRRASRPTAGCGWRC